MKSAFGVDHGEVSKGLGNTLGRGAYKAAYAIRGGMGKGPLGEFRPPAKSPAKLKPYKKGEGPNLPPLPAHIR